MIPGSSPAQNILVSILLFTTLLFFPTLSVQSNETRSERVISVNLSDSVYSLNGFQLKRGERLFFGLIPIDKELPACADCHSINYFDSLNWNPSAFEIAGTFHGKKVEDLISVINNPLGKRMSDAHAGYKIDEQQAILLQAYLEKLQIEGPPHRRPIVNNLILFLLVNLLGIFATIDLIFTRKIPYRFVHLLLISFAAIYLTKVLMVESIALGRSENYEPAQPIKFSHMVHAGQNQIDCKYCHTTAETSKTASIPSVNICLNCHTLVREGTRSGKFEINKIIQAAENNKPVEWIKVHNLPEYVFFSHAQHVSAGKLDCQVCHGDVKTMDRIVQVKDLSMGWCVNCHRDTKVQFDENPFYKQYQDFHKQLKEGKIDHVTIAEIGGIDCMKCHY
jgi:hypothetical protein